MILKVKSHGPLTNLFLKNKSTFRVQHLFNTTAYLREEKSDAMLLLSKQKWRGAYIINLEDTSINLQSILRPEEELYFHGTMLVGKGIELDFSSSELYSKAEKAKEIKSFSSKELSFLMKAFSILSALWDGFDRREEFRRVCMSLKLGPLQRESLKSLIGAGGGFTPSGDDFISGYVSALVYASNVHPGVLEEVSFVAVKELLARTTWASAKYIEYSMNGFFDELAEFALRSLFSADLEGSLEAMIHYLRRGHESGLYIWIGLISGYAHIINRESFVMKSLCSRD